MRAHHQAGPDGCDAPSGVRRINGGGEPGLRRVMHRSDPRLIDACLAGDASAWDAFVDRYARLIYSIPKRYGLDDADCDDVVQQVFVIAWQRLASLRDQERLSAWLITTAHREAWRIGRRAGRPVDLAERIQDVGEPDGVDADAWERQHLVREGLRRLGGRCERLLTALFRAGDAPVYEDIAEQLDMPIGSIGPTRARCFRKLMPILEALGFEATTK